MDSRILGIPTLILGQMMRDWKLNKQYRFPSKHTRPPLRYFLMHKCDNRYSKNWKDWYTCWRPRRQEWVCISCGVEAPAEIAFVADLAGCESRK